ncbi:acyl-CoA dehydrogenase family protein [Streptomyces sp. FH025]|uniref:acyl-CoA dehydrogenase family protein n=1 Tax=Streptomyces sp. FH025 TaxID=2815937 RepID=UPI001A9DF405|nr:acyl-CoA dehydrogenase family protein [Streptomyces sp. FH025]MBO1414204.1 acyl-CoA/acyl-ACP dehydrogenase [Streptomyces sp. FH025]
MSPSAVADVAAETFLTSLETGRLEWSRLRSFPEQDRADRERGDEVLREVEVFFAEHVDPTEVDETRSLPAGLAEGLQERGFLRLGIAPELGGLGLSPYNVFRVVAQACAHSLPAGQILAIQNGVGAAALLPGLPEGSVREFLGRRLAEGIVSGFGDTDSTGQNNVRKSLTATPVEGGYRLDGEKLFTGNGPIADLVGVSAMMPGENGPMVGAFFLDTDTPGFSVTSRIEFMGSRGLPNGALRFDGVFVPEEQVLVDRRTGQLPASVGMMALQGRIFFTGAPAMAVARRCLEWSREFVRRRSVDGRGLGEYEEIQHLLTASLAEVYAMESVARWSLVGAGPSDRLFERFAAKNLLVRGSWRIVDRTMSLFGGEGFETVPSKLRRGAVPTPLERAFRDARGLRIAGNIDFQLDNHLGRMVLSAVQRAGAARPTARAEEPRDPRLSPANLAHLAELDERVREFHRFAADLVDTVPDQAELFARERTVVLLGRIAAELFTASAVLARAAAVEPGGTEQELADLHCVEAHHRLAGLFGRLTAAGGPDHAKISRNWLAAEGADPLTRH